MYKRHRFPPEIIQHVVWLYHRFNMSNRYVKDLMAERGISVSYESIRLWCIKFGSKYAKRLRGRHQGYGDTFYLDEVYVRTQRVQHYLWHAIDQDGEVEAIQVNSSGTTISYHPRRCIQFIQSGTAFDFRQTLSALPSAKPTLGVLRAFATWKCTAAL